VRRTELSIFAPGRTACHRVWNRSVSAKIDSYIDAGQTRHCPCISSVWFQHLPAISPMLSCDGFSVGDAFRRPFFSSFVRETCNDSRTASLMSVVWPMDTETSRIRAGVMAVCFLFTSAVINECFNSFGNCNSPSHSNGCVSSQCANKRHH
jgi:hypothetical protein